MPGVINLLKTYTTVDNTLTPSLARGIAFKAGSGNIYLAVINSTFLALLKSTGAVVFATNALNTMFQLIYDPVTDIFFGAPGGGAPINSIGRFTSAGALIDRPATGANPYGEIVESGSWFGGDTASTNVDVLVAATGAGLPAINTGVAGPTNGVGQWAFDGTSIWTADGNANLIQIDPVARTLTNVFNLSGQGVGRIHGICFAGGSLWISDTNFFSSSLRQCDLAGTVLNSFFAFDCGPLVFDGTYFWIGGLFNGSLSVYTSAGAAETFTFFSSGQFIAHDPDDPPGFIWATSGGPPFEVQQFQFVPPVPPASFRSFGSFNPTLAGGIVGGTK